VSHPEHGGNIQLPPAVERQKIRGCDRPLFHHIRGSARDTQRDDHDLCALLPSAWPAWLGEGTGPKRSRRCWPPYPSDDMEIWPVDKRVGNVGNNDPALVEPLALA
jgi:hypothetical protein